MYYKLSRALALDLIIKFTWAGENYTIIIEMLLSLESMYSQIIYSLPYG